MTNDELEAVRARAEAATAGPWEWRWGAILGQWSLAPGVLLADGTDGTPGGDKIDVENAEFIAHARADIPALLDEVERLREERAQAVDAANDWHGKAAYEEDRATRAEAHAERLAGALKLARPLALPHSGLGSILDIIDQALSAYRSEKDEACSRPSDALDAPVADQSTACSQPERTER